MPLTISLANRANAVDMLRLLSYTLVTLSDSVILGCYHSLM